MNDKEYFFDYEKSLLLNLDYNKNLFISLKQGENNEIIPEISYLGNDKRTGENIKKNILSIASFKRENDKISLYIGDEKFAGFIIDENQGVSIDKNVPQNQLTAFEMRLLARGKDKVFSPFSRDVNKNLAPKTDLHTHFAGALSPESLVKIGLQHNISIPNYLLEKLDINTSGFDKDENGNTLLSSLNSNKIALSKFKDALRIPLDKQETFNKMEEIYEMRGPFSKNSSLLPDMLREMGKSFSENGVKYTELSLSSVIGDMNTLKTINEVLPEVEKETGCKIRFLAALWRHSDKEWNQDEVDRIKAVAQNPYVVGLDVMGHETNPTEMFAEEIRELSKWAMQNDPSFCIRVHAGENPLFQDNVKDVLKAVKEVHDELEEKLGTNIQYPKVRIGHGLYGVDDEALTLAKQIGAVIEFNMSSNLSLNNIDSSHDVPLKSYVDRKIPFVLGTDGCGIYSTSPEQELILAKATGLRGIDFIKMRLTEDKIIEDADKAFAMKSKIFNKKLESMSFEEALTPKYSTENGKPRYNNEVALKYKKEKEELMSFLESEISKCGAETNSVKIEKDTDGKTPILLTGASVKAWPSISKENQDEIKLAMQVLANTLNPDKAYVLTGGTNHGVEKTFHEAANRRNNNNKDKLIVMGTLTQEAAYKEKASIEKDTITHATVLSLNNRIAKTWFDLPDATLDYVQKRQGEIIAIGGGGVVRDMIQRAHNMGMGLNLMNGPEGASTDKTLSLKGNDYGFVGAKGLMTKLYDKKPELFHKDFDIENIDKYISEARDQLNLSKENKMEKLLSNAEVEKMFENPTIEAIPSDMKRIIIPAYNFAGAQKAMRGEWGPNGPFEEEVEGLVFDNPKDGSKQVLKKNEGCLICYDGPGRKEKIEEYLKENPETFKNTVRLKKFIDYLKSNVVNDSGKADLWDTDLNFAAGLKDAPAKEAFKLGFVGSYVKKNEAVEAVMVKEGTMYQGPTGSPQVADKEGAYLVKDKNGIRMVQKQEFLKAYNITKDTTKNIMMTKQSQNG